ncbi:MAG: hypothetical protein HQ568_06670, partial [Calditrichaeota bacterium]|nr:hypothetical protein [Calditrichota bacterium]
MSDDNGEIKNSEEAEEKETTEPTRDRCSFCDRQIDMTRVMVKGDSAAICDVCVAGAAQIVKRVIAQKRTALRDQI